MSESGAKPPPTDEELRQAALLGARLGGCTCNPEIRIRREGGIAHADIAHDDGCAHFWMQKGNDA